MSDVILYEKRENIGIITINRPKANQLSGEVFEEFRKALDVCEADKELRAIVVTGSGDKIFSAGADLSSGFGDYGPVDFLKRGQDLCNKIEDFPRPVIAALNGHAFGGGCEIAMACHFRFMSDEARIGLTETNIGIMPGYGGSLRMPRLVGRAKALEYICFAKQIDAAEALAVGLVNYVFPKDKVLEEAIEFAKKLAARPPLAEARSSSCCREPQHLPRAAPQDRARVARKALRLEGYGRGSYCLHAEASPVFTGE
jgi:enoyl-CoA hydratase/carnithine racemase